MLADREHIQPDFLGLLRDRRDRVDPLRLARRLPRHGIPGDVTDREDPELHGLPPTLPACPRCSARAPIGICVCMYLNTESAGLFRGTAGAASTMARQARRRGGRPRVRETSRTRSPGRPPL